MQTVVKKCTLKKEEKKKPLNKEMPAKWLEVIGLMTVGGLDFQPAMEVAGYSEAYYKTDGHLIKQDPRFSKALEAKKAEISHKSEDLRKEITNYLLEIVRNPEEATRDRNAAAKELGATHGWHSETIKHETTERQAILDCNNRAEAARLAILALDTRQLPSASHGRKTIPSIVSGSHDVSDIDCDSHDVSDMPMTDDTIILPIDLG